MTYNVILRTPTHVELAITEQCNHRCSHCYNAWRNHDSSKGIMSIEQREYIFRELKQNQVNYVTLTGGEPLMDQESMFWFIEKFRENNIGIGLNTNLTLMTDQIAERLVDQYNWKNTILTSLPGFTAEECDQTTNVSGSFVNIGNGIDVCLRNGIDVGVNVVITHDNIKRVEELSSFLDKYKISTLALTRVVPPIYNSDDPTFLLDRDDINRIVKFLKEIKNRYDIRVTSLCSLPFCLIDDTEDISFLSTKCAAGIVGCSINAISGAITPCAHNEKTYGNIYSDGLRETWKRMSPWREGNYIPEECKKCAMLAACGGDCRLNGIRIKERPYSLDGTCKFSLVSSNDHIKYDRTETYYFNNKTFLREEAFGAVVSNGINEFYVSTSIYRLLCTLREWGTFTHKDLEKIVCINVFLERQLSQWISAGIIYTIEQ